MENCFGSRGREEQSTVGPVIEWAMLNNPSEVKPKIVEGSMLSFFEYLDDRLIGDPVQLQSYAFW